jgi:hypothetical protein
MRSPSSKRHPASRVSHRGTRAILFAALAALAITALPLRSEAVPPLLRPATRGMFATFGFGPAIQIEWLPGQFKIEQAFGWHFSGTGAGPAIGIHLAESFGNNFFGFAVGPRFWYDIQPMANLGLYIAPFAQLGFAVASASGCSGDGCTQAAFNMVFGGEVRLALADRGIVFFRPFSLDFFIQDEFAMRYNLMFGGGVYF